MTPHSISPIFIDQIKNIRFTNQCWRPNILPHPGNRVGLSGGCGARFGANWLVKPRTEGRLTMSANIPVLPIAGGILVRALASLLAVVTHWLKQLMRARRHRREARALATFNQRMLADIGITAPMWATPSPSRSGKTRPCCCASARSSAA
jgi:uncharacterized protein YjiS (DUF1127 family)